MNGLRCAILLVFAIVLCFANDEDNFFASWIKPSPNLRSMSRSRYSGRLLPQRMYRSGPNTWDLPVDE
ncbi:unnamed protein product [Caenorhabditis angaria]|uniref:Uncharacterized protein n=1 Tax=Caenorhabditis angaria TaxID=860376 RepID=A0A9P1IY11_9PELO|nr:unnamed protein product [Caenorhabditis angaria]